MASAMATLAAAAAAAGCGSGGGGGTGLLDLRIELSKLLESWESASRSESGDVCPVLQQ